MAREKGKHVKGLFAQIADADRRHFHSLSLSARWAFVELTLAYWRDADHRNPVPMSARALTKLFPCNKETACRVLRELVGAGFLKKDRDRAGAMTGKYGERAAVYTMTWLSIDGTADSATFDYRAKNRTSEKTSQQRTEDRDVENAAETMPAETSNAKERKGFEAAISGDFAEAPNGTYSQNLKVCTPEAPRQFLAALPSPDHLAVTATIEQSRRNAERTPAPQLPIPTTTARTA